MRIAICNLGCKVNQFDGAAILANFSSEGDHRVVPFQEMADVYLVNTCSVTGKSEAEARHWVRRAVRNNPDAKVVVTGCYAQTNPDALAKIPGVSMVLGNEEKFDLRRYLQEDLPSCRHSDWHEEPGWPNQDAALNGRPPPHVVVGDIRKVQFLTQPLVEEIPSKTRAFFKIQDGCNSRCSFCIIPMSRGKSRSLPLEQAIRQLRLFESQGYQEVVFSGIHLGSYGRDLSEQIRLTDLLRAAMEETRIPRFRISSIEPREVSPELIKLMGETKRICRHLHIPMQSGSDSVLRKMNRNYAASDYEDLLYYLRKSLGTIGIGTDVMVGFPGEGEVEFSDTYQMIERLPLYYLHVFPYSSRPGTGAERLRETVDRKTKDHRVAVLRTLSLSKKKNYIQRHIGNIVNVLLEEPPTEGGAEIWEGHSNLYFRVRLLPMGPDLARNTLVDVLITGLQSTVDDCLAVGRRIGPEPCRPSLPSV